MAKRSHSLSLKGLFIHQTGLIEEATKNKETKEIDVRYYKLYDLLKEFDSRQVSITIKEDDEIESVDENELV
ncbi:YonK family protein [Brevibacillus laterosporus]|uniref:YonK family protein n=1 Tax=Brevibacillus laterosporus TaxID=1465 RepID=UPI003D229A23